MTFEFRVLGPITAWRDGLAVRLNGRKTRSVLAALLLRSDHVVPVERLVAILWGESPPPTAVAQIQKCVSQLRGEFGPELIIRSGNGYRLQLGEHRFDLRTFDQAVADARAALGQDRRLDAVEAYCAGLAQWRGEPLADGTEELIRTESPALEERRIGVVMERIEAELALGRHGELVSELKALVGEQPLRERLRGQLMLALYRCGRVADALAVYQAGRTLIAEELGLEPGGELQRLHEAILVGGPGLDLPRKTPASEEAPERVWSPIAQVVPAQLPPSIADFTGRAEQVGRIRETLTTGDKESLALVALSGKGGVGKSTLAVQAARRVAEQFPDGQLYIRLRTADARPLDPLVALKRFLRALGVGEEGIPDDLEECSELFRSRTASSRMLILLDDAVSEAQVRPLLPGSPGCVVLITSRPRLAGLESATHIDLDVFNAEESGALIERIAGRHRVAGDEATTAEVARLCGYLPLAVRIAAARLAQHSQGGITRFARRLADERRRLDVLVSGDLEVRATLATGYQELEPREREAFCLLGLIDTPDFASWLLAPLLRITIDEAEDLIEELVSTQLLDVVGCDAAGQTRYRYHNLVRLYAKERAQAEYSPAQCREALSRVLDGWLTLSTTAAQRITGARSREWPAAERGAAHRYDGFDRSDVDYIVEDPYLWFEAERPALASAVAMACSNGFGRIAWELADSTTDFLELRHLYDDWEASHRLALAAAEADADTVGVGVMSLRLAGLRCIRREPEAGLELADRAVAVFGELGLAALESECRVIRAGALRALGRLEPALAEVTRAAESAQASSSGLAQALAARELGTIRYEQRSWELSSAAFKEAVRLSRLAGNRREEALALRHWAVVLRHRGELQEAREKAETALAAFHELGDRPYEAFSGLTLGLSLLELRDPSARRFIEEGHAVLRDMNLEFGMGELFYVLASLELADGHIDRAVDRLAQSIRWLGTEPVHHVLLSAVELLCRALDAGDPAAGRVLRRELAELSACVGARAPAHRIESILAQVSRRVTGRNPVVTLSRVPVLQPLH
ncbi:MULTISPECIES: AfsR/SARP family transcriptional regulator [Streptomyces]|uniref:AfsR/SARP family transcriptional regulator n=1 Tax=Streptomyces TaxID=1883 RepID=UPI0029D02094|nr:BTAD domain-containing putative transcriptional regulator [Streptomyces sp. F8]MDX6758984.1 BTAD domain-containing putative transcriptional regulator [Streptomyces sp. F8]